MRDSPKKVRDDSPAPVANASRWRDYCPNGGAVPSRRGRLTTAPAGRHHGPWSYILPEIPLSNVIPLRQRIRATVAPTVSPTYEHSLAAHMLVERLRVAGHLREWLAAGETLLLRR